MKTNKKRNRKKLRKTNKYYGGKKIYSNGDIYNGKLNSEGKKEGKGTMIYANGDKYEGDWIDDTKKGKGTMIYKNGDIYEGYWMDDKKEGEDEDEIGIMTYANGDIYTGSWENDKKSFDGVYKYAPNAENEYGYVEYDGEWRNEYKNGYGTMIFADGRGYAGEWNDDMPECDNDYHLSGDWSGQDWGCIHVQPIGVNINRDIATEIHRAAGKINLDEYLKIINGTSDSKNASDYGDIATYVKSKFEPYIDSHFIESTKQPTKSKLNGVLQRFTQASELYNNPKYVKLVGNTIDFVFAQSDEFIDFYIATFIQDCYHAYSDDGEAGMSCIAGILERIYMIVGDAVFAMCPEEATCDNPTYIELLKFFGKRVDKNELTQKWANTYLETDEIKNMKTTEERKAHYIAFMEGEYKKLGLLDDYAKKIITDEAESINYVFDTLQFGGKKRRKSRKTRKSRKKI